MAAQEFEHAAKGKTMAEAFNTAVEEAAYDYGHAGYTGTIAEKMGFVNFGELPPTLTVSELLDWIYNDCWTEGDGPIPLDLRDKAGAINDTFSDKWGPACGFKVKDGQYFFTGLASS